MPANFSPAAFNAAREKLAAEIVATCAATGRTVSEAHAGQAAGAIVSAGDLAKAIRDELYNTDAIDCRVALYAYQSALTSLAAPALKVAA